MDIKEIKLRWQKSGFTPPSRYLLDCIGRFYAVVEDNTTIIKVVSTTGIVYSVARNRIKEYNTNIGGLSVPIYQLDDTDNLKIISCTRESIEKKHKDQIFVINEIIGLIKN
jgi:hypothetical protein